MFRYGAAEVDGSVQSAQSGNGVSVQSSPPSGALIALIPDTLRPDGSGIYSANIDQNGSFIIRQLAPGRYRAYAFAQADRNALPETPIS